MKIYTKTGDDGSTRLLFGGRVPKTDQRAVAYGTVDEAISAMALARALSQDEWARAQLYGTQRDLFTVAAELATDTEHYPKFREIYKPVTPEMTTRIERAIDEIDAHIKLPRAFIIPGASPASAAMDVARTVVRRAEREIVALDRSGGLSNREILRFVNRCSDFLFMLARFEDRSLAYEEVTDTRVERSSGQAKSGQTGPGQAGSAGQAGS
ncbi:MAG: cob(I)yrinic acid a,c-diamide adenosyltransferase [Chloroflexi bacterium]|nr:cob(I)yrinic acid a,c-diamide adenosyltransferase [Chloroflexota bacterium]